MKRFFSYFIPFLLFVPTLLFFTDLTRNPYYFQIILANAGIAVLWVLWLYNETSRRRVNYYTTPIDLPLWLFFAAATVSWLVMYVSNLSHPYLHNGIFNEGLKNWLFLIFNAVLVYYAAVFFVDDTNRPRTILTVLWAGIIAAVYGVLQYFGVELIWPQVLNPFGGRSVSTFGNPNFLSSYLIMIMPLFFVAYAQAASSSRRAFYLAAMLASFAALLCTMTRSSWMGLFFAMLLLVALIAKYENTFFRKYRKAILVPFALFVLTALFWPKSNVSGYAPSVIGRLTESAEASASKTYYAPWHQRRLIWSCAWHMVIENPVIGKGWGCFELFYPSYQGRHLFHPAYINFRTHANNTHNEILEIWSQTGTLGFGIYLWLMASIFTYGFFLIKNLTGNKRFLAMALTASTAGMLIDNLLNVSLHFAIPAFLFWWNIGLLAGLARTQSKTLELKKTHLVALAWLVIIAGGLAVVRYTNNFLAEIHYFKGFKVSKRENPQAAIPHLEKAHSLQRLEVNNNYELANCYARSGMRDKALNAYKEALRANSGYDEIYFNLATVLAQKGDTEEAIDEYSRSLYINPLSVESYNALGSIFLQDPDRYARAGIELFKQCLVLFPAKKDIWNNLGFLYTRIDNDEEALAAYKKAYEIDPDFELAKKNIHVTLAKTGRRDTSFEESERLFRRIEEAIGAKNWASAKTSCEKLLTLAPQSFKARFYMGNIYFTLGSVEGALEQYHKALELEPSNPAILGNLGLVYFETKQYERSRETFQKLLQQNPRNEFARERLNQINNIINSR